MTKTAQIIGSHMGLSPDLEAWICDSKAMVGPWAQAQFDSAVCDIFGYHALQLGSPCLNTLGNCRIPHKWLSADVQQGITNTQLIASASALPFFEATLDLVTLPLTLDAHTDPEQVIEECTRVLVPEGKLVVVGINPKSLWGIRQVLGLEVWPRALRPYGYQNLLQSLSELGFSVSAGRFGGYGSTVQGHSRTMEKAGDRWWPHRGGLYTLTAIKRVKGVTPRLRRRFVMPSWQQVLAPLNPFPKPQPRPLSKPPTKND